MTIGAPQEHSPRCSWLSETGDDAGISYVLIVDEPGMEKAGGTADTMLMDTEVVEMGDEKKQSVYHIADGNNILIEEEDEEDVEEHQQQQEEEGDMLVESVLLNEALQIKTEKGSSPTKRLSTKVLKTAPPDLEGELLCSYCNYVTTKRHLLSRHMKCHSEERPYRCSVCERGFKTSASLNNHVNTHTGTKPHRCKHCASTFTTSGELVRHVRYRHTLEKPHKCSECDYASVELSKLRRHIRCHTGERPYQCPHCTYASPDTFKLKRHLRIHTGEKPYQCDICQARFTQSNSMKAHKLIHNVGDKPTFKCDFCPTTCGRKTDLRIHIQKLHTSDTPFPCKKCHETFQDRYTYKQHCKTHEGEKCFKCDYCDYKTVNARQLDSHILVHTDEKPFGCPSCDQSFRQKQLLRRHQNLYHNPNYVAPKPKDKTHQCPTCARGFHHKGNLIRHMAVHDPSSAVHEESAQLKMGRKLKIETDGTAGYSESYEYSECEEEDVEEYEEGGEEEEEEEVDAIITVEPEEEDVNRFEVLEVINEDEVELEG